MYVTSTNPREGNKLGGQHRHIRPSAHFVRGKAAFLLTSEAGSVKLSVIKALPPNSLNVLFRNLYSLNWEGEEDITLPRA